MKTIIASLIILFSLPGLTLADNNKDKAKKPVATKKDSADNKKAGADNAARETAAKKKAAQEKAARAARAAAVRKKAAAGKAAREAAAMTGGRVLDVQPVREGERQAFHVKVLLDDGRVQLIELGGEPHDTPDSNDK